MKKSLGVLLLAAALVLLFSGVAFANFGPHGGYSTTTDACAGCHRAHTSVSAVTWTDSATPAKSHSALLVSNATTMKDFCFACHGEGAPGAATNVYSGVFDAGPSTAGGAATSTAQPYMTNSTLNATLNGGGFGQFPSGAGFVPVSSMHNMDAGPVPVWGAGNSITILPTLTCTDCHDPHGSSNYRLLKDRVTGNDPSNGYQFGGRNVGGYDANDVPTPFVWSAEQGYPRPNGAGFAGGWLKHEPGASQMATYVPNYTRAEYAYVNPGVDSAGNAYGGPEKNMSMWCSGCHTDYGDNTEGQAGAGSLPGSSANYSITATGGATGYEQAKSINVSMGGRARHRHPVNISLAAGVGPARALAAEVVISGSLPLDKLDFASHAATWTTNDMIDCLTCHRAHGVETTMSGWASASLDSTTNASAVVTWFPILDVGRGGGVNPSGDSTMSDAYGMPNQGTSSLLRLNNRGVCEVCHNK